VTYFRTNDGQHGTELWRSDGTAEGTFMLLDIFPGSRSSGPRRFFEFNGLMYFVANDGEHGYELWRTDGTAANTEMVKDIWPGIDAVIDTGPITIGDKFYFVASDGVHGKELWESDGTSGGTNMLFDLTEGLFGTPIVQMVEHEGSLVYFIDQEEASPGTDFENGIWQWSIGAAAPFELYERQQLIRFLPPTAFESFQGEVIIRENRNGRVLWLDIVQNSFETGVDSRGSTLPLGILPSHFLVDASDGVYRVDSNFTAERIETRPPNAMHVVGDSVYYWVPDEVDSSLGDLVRFQPGNPLTTVLDAVPITAIHGVNDQLIVEQINADLGFDLWRIENDAPTLLGSIDAKPTELVRLTDTTIAISKTDGRETVFAIPDLGSETLPSATEIDALFEAIRSNSNDEQFDANDDGMVNEQDIDHVFENVLQTNRADLDLNGTVGFADFLQLSTNFGKTNAKWSDGDINGDKEVSFADFLLLSDAFGT